MSDADERDLEGDDVEENEEEEHEEGEEGDDNGDAGAAQEPAEPEEELEDEKPFDGDLVVPGLCVPNVQTATVRFVEASDAPADRLPHWLRYVVNDDAYWLERCILGKVQPPAADAAEKGGDADDEEADAEAAGGDAEAGGDAAAAEAAGDGEQSGGADHAVAPNAEFVIVQNFPGADQFQCRPYVPPAPVEENDEEGAGEGEGGADGDAGAEGGDAEGEDEGEDDAEGADEDAAGGARGADDEEEEEKPAEVIVDALTLAALLSRDCLRLLLRMPGTHLRRLTTFSAERFASGERTALDSVLYAIRAASTQTPIGPSAAAADAAEADAGAAGEGTDGETQPEKQQQAAPKTVGLPRRAVDFNWLIQLHNTEAPANASAAAEREAKAVLRDATAYMSQLLAVSVVPDAPIAATHLRTAPAVNAYLTLLLTMPKSILTQWSKPVAGEDGDDGGSGEVPEEAAEEAQQATNAPVARFLYVILLDLRRRAAREAKGKPPLREPIATSHKRPLQVLRILGGGDKGADTIAAPQFATRDYCPQHLQLRMSDLALAATGRFEFAAESFSTLLALRMGVPRRRDAPVGFPALLFASIALHLCASATKTVVEQGDPEWFAPNGAVDIHAWASGGLSDKPEAFGDAVATTFAQRFGPHFVADQRLLGATDDSCKTLYEKLREVERFAESAAKELLKPSSECNVDALEEALARCGPAHICTPEMLHRAAAARNATGVAWLVQQGVASVALPGTVQTVPLLEFAVRFLKDAALTLALVDLGADLAAPWEGGLTSGICAVQDHFAADDADAVLGAYRQREAERYADPRCKFGLLHASAA